MPISTTQPTDSQERESTQPLQFHGPQLGAVKYDQGKLRYDLIPAEALEEIAKVFTHGAATYGANNWKEEVDLDRYFAALMRHLMKWRKGAITDEDSCHKLKHLAQVAVNAIFLMCHPQVLASEQSAQRMTIEEFKKMNQADGGMNLFGGPVWGFPQEKNYPYEHASKEELISDLKWKDDALKKMQQMILDLEKKLEESNTNLSKSKLPQYPF